MMCARLQLRERTKTSKTRRDHSSEKPRRICQKRLVDPNHEEDPRWTAALDRFYCNNSETNCTKNSQIINNVQDDLFLSVQNLKFQGNEHERKRPRTSFKYRSVTDNNTHRMFVKEPVTTVETLDEDTSSQLTNYYYDDYSEYLCNNDRSRPSSGKSSIFMQGLGTKCHKNKAIQVDFSKKEAKKTAKVEFKKPVIVTEPTTENTDDSELLNAEDDKTKITFQKSGKRQSLTISRAPSPETVQVIRVDVICNYSSSSTLSECDNEKHNKSNVKESKTNENTNLKIPNFTKKYLLTNTIKSLEEKVYGGAKVTLLCKNFRLSDRSTN